MDDRSKHSKDLMPTQDYLQRTSLVNLRGRNFYPYSVQQVGDRTDIYMDGNILYINIDDILERFVGTLAYNTTVSSTNFYAGVMWQLQRESMNSTNVYLYNYPYGNSTSVISKNYTMPLQDLANIAVDSPNGIIFHCSNGGYFTAAINAKTGELMWNKESDAYFEGQGTVLNGVGIIGSESTMKAYGFDLKTGQQLWVSEPNDYPWGAFRAYSAGAAYDKFYLLSYDGTVRAYSYNNGTTVWKYFNGIDTTRESPYGTYPFYNNPAIAGRNNISQPPQNTHQHYPSREATESTHINAQTGQLLWNIIGCNSTISHSRRSTRSIRLIHAHDVRLRQRTNSHNSHRIT